MIKVITSFSCLSDSVFLLKAQKIADSMSDNAHFTDPVPALTLVQTAILDFEAALSQMREGGRHFTVIKNQKRTVLDGLLLQLALFVQLHSKDDPAIVLTSGFEPTKPKIPVGPLAKPRNLDGYTQKGK